MNCQAWLHWLIWGEKLLFIGSLLEGCGFPGSSRGCTGKNDQEHFQTLTKVLQWLKEAGLRLKRTKCSFMCAEVIFHGQIVDATGLHPVHEKVQTIKEAPTPSNVTELNAYLVLLNYYNKFLPKLSTSLALLQKTATAGHKVAVEGRTKGCI